MLRAGDGGEEAGNDAKQKPSTVPGQQTSCTGRQACTSCPDPGTCRLGEGRTKEMCEAAVYALLVPLAACGRAGTRAAGHAAESGGSGPALSQKARVPSPALNFSA